MLCLLLNLLNALQKALMQTESVHVFYKIHYAIQNTAAISNITFVCVEIYSTNRCMFWSFALLVASCSIHIKRGLHWVELILHCIISCGWLEMWSLYQPLTSPTVHVIKIRQCCNLTSPIKKRAAFHSYSSSISLKSSIDESAKQIDVINAQVVWKGHGHVYKPFITCSAYLLSAHWNTTLASMSWILMATNWPFLCVGENVTGCTKSCG